MCNAHNHAPGCTCGWGGGKSGFVKRIASRNGFLTIPIDAVWNHGDSCCAPSVCKFCGATVFFVRHNGGSVFFDSLGWPWPKHACLVKAREPTWYLYISRRTQGEVKRFSSIGVIVRAKWICSSPPLPSRVVLAFDGGVGHRKCISVHGSNSADYYLGQIAAISDRYESIVLSNNNDQPIVERRVSPKELDLDENWEQWD